MNRSRRPATATALGGLAALSCLLLLPPPASAAADGCLTTRSASDFNGDGYDDAAVGDPYATVNGLREAGAVTVLLGDADGRIGEGGRTVVTRSSLGEPAKAGDHFGFDVALAPTGRHGRCADLLVGAPGADLPGAANAGVVYLVADLPDLEGTPAMEALVLTQDDAKGNAEAGDGLGHAVMITGVNQEDRTRLVVGAPGEDAGTATDAGAVSVWEMDEDPVGLAELRQGRRGPLGAIRLPGTPQTGDRFGTSLTGGLVDLPQWSGQDVAQGLVIGAPGDTVSGRAGAGSVTVLQEKYEYAALLSQDTPEVAGVPETGDGFGYSVALRPKAGSRSATLAVGAPGEDVDGRTDTGSVTLLSNAGRKFVPRTAFTQATRGVPGTNERGDQLGFSLAFGAGIPTLMVGVPTEDVGSVVDAGSVQPVEVPGTGQSLRFLPVVTENASGTPGSVGTGNRFGRSLGALSGQAESIRTISSVYAGQGSVYVLTDGADLPPRSWLPATSAGRFGWAVSN